MSGEVVPERLSQRIARDALRVTPNDVPATTWAYLKCCVADAIGIAMASRHYDFARRTEMGLAGFAEQGEAVVIGSRRRWPTRDAAMINGVLIHGLDYDDTHLASVVHCSASALPVALALAGEGHISGRECLMAVLIATEIDGRLGSAAGGLFQQLGFHPTGLVGLFGAVVAAVRLMGGSEADAVRAQGIALSTTAGSMAFLDEGSWTKRLHPGWAASSALTAASLAMSGFEAPSEAYAGRYGFFSLYTRDEKNAARVNWDSSFGAWTLDDVAIKPYPVCHFNHALIDSALALRDEYGVTPDDIVEGTVLLHEHQFGVVVEPLAAKRRPRSEYDAKFSAPYAVATALVHGRFGLQELEAPARADAQVLALAERLQCSHDDRSLYPAKFSGGLQLKLKNGTTLEHYESVNRGAEGRLLSQEEVKSKFQQNCALSLSASHTEVLWQAIMTLDASGDCRDLLQLLCSPKAAV